MTRDERRLRAGLAAHAGWRPSLELALPPRLFYTVVASFAADRAAGAGEHELFAAAAPALRDAIHGALGPQMMRAGRDGWCPLDLLGALNFHLLLPCQRLGRATVITAVTNLVTQLDSDGIVLLPDSGPVRAALEAVVGVVNAHPDLVAQTERSGRKNGRRLLEACRGLGLYLPAAEVA